MPPQGLQSQNVGLVKNCLTSRYISAWCMTLLKIIQIEPYLNLIYVFLWTIIGIFLSPRGITVPKIIRGDPNSNSSCVFSWHIYILNFNSKCLFVMEINERKLKINGIFLIPRDITLPKIIRPDQNSNSTCIFSWHIYILNFKSKCEFVMEIMSGNWKLMEFF